MQLALRLARQITVALSIVLMLGAVVMSAQSSTAHASILLGAASMPCHHALDSGSVATSPLDLCRELCLTQAPDTMVAPTGISTTPSVVTELLPVNKFVFLADAPTRPMRVVPAAHAPPRPTPYPATTKLLI